jgi:hypothetical protein
LLTRGVPPACELSVETLHPAETLHAYSVFYFHRMQSFHDLAQQGPDSGLLAGRAGPNGNSLNLTVLRLGCGATSIAGEARSRGFRESSPG